MDKDEEIARLREENRQLKEELEVIRKWISSRGGNFRTAMKAYAIERLIEWHRDEEAEEENKSITDLYGLALEDKEEVQTNEEGRERRMEVVASTSSSEDESQGESVRTEDSEMGTNNIW